MSQEESHVMYVRLISKILVTQGLDMRATLNSSSHPLLLCGQARSSKANRLPLYINAIILCQNHSFSSPVVLFPFY